MININAGAGFYYWELKFDEIFTENKVNFNESNQYVDLNSESDLIVGSNEFKKYLLTLIEELNKTNKCFNDKFKGYEEINDHYSDYEFFYCKNDKDTKKKLYEIIPSLYFFSKELQYTFELTNDQILLENGDYIYINIVFTFSYKWRLGKQIALKYKFVYNTEGKKIGFYKKYKDKEKSNKYSKYLYYLLILGLCIIFGVLGVILGRYLYNQNKKKRANELKDDDYEYFPEEKNNKNEIVPENIIYNIKILFK